MNLRFFNAYDTATPFFRNLIPSLSARCHDVEIVLSRAKYRESDLGRILSQYEGVKVTQLWAPTLRHGSSLGRVLVYLSYWCQAMAMSIMGGRVDVNVFLTQPPLIGWLGTLLKKLRGQDYVLILMDIYPDILQALRQRRKLRTWDQIPRKLALASYRGARDVVVIGRCMKRHLLSKDAKLKRIHVIPNWADEREIQPVDHRTNAFRQSQPWKNRFVIMYAGNIGIPQWFDDLLEAAPRLSSRDDLAFVIVGEGSRLEWLRSRNRHWKTFQPLPLSLPPYQTSAQ